MQTEPSTSAQATAGTATPIKDGFSVPGRWVEHERTLVSWPPREWSYAPGHLLDARREWAEVTRAIRRFEPVTVIANPGDGELAQELCGADVEVIEIPIDDCYVRDNGPIFVTNSNGDVAMTHFQFNGWGAKMPPWDKDARVGERLAERWGMRRYAAPIIVEGGGITFDGEGTAITTESVLLNPNRNPEMSKEDKERLLHEYLGIEKVIWLPYGLAEDMGEMSTDGHSDNVVQFIRPGLALLQTAPSPSNPNWQLAEANRAALQGAIDARGREIEIVEIDLLSYTREIEGTRYAAPYTNYYPVNGGIIAPRLDVPEDEMAYQLLRELFPGREVVGVPTDYMAYGGGGVGCITQQVPAGSWVKAEPDGAESR
jgi:agmatine deiminase